MSIHIIKLGGSLLDLPDLPARFAAYLSAQPTAPRIVVVGGGDAAEIVRHFDRRFSLDEERGHWLAVRAMELNAHLFSSVMPGAVLAADAAGCRSAWSRGLLAVMDPLKWLTEEESRGVRVPHLWQFTSDSIAAHVARQLGAARLTLLKSVSLERPCTLAQAAAGGVVDQEFPAAAEGLETIEIINLRAWPAPAVRLR